MSYDFSRGFEIDLNRICSNSPYGARIASYLSAYHGKKYDFLDFWLQRDEQNRAVCAFCRYYQTLIICGSPSSIEEAEDFIAVLSPSSVLCSSDFTARINLHFTQGETMRCRPLPYLKEGEKRGISVIRSDMAAIREFYNLLVSANKSTDALPKFESFFLDLSHRVRHGTSEIYGIRNEKGELVSAAAVIAKSSDTAVIGCVATDKEYRRQGLAYKLVEFVTKKMQSEEKAVYLHREKKIEIYEKIGYKTVGYWREYSS